MYGFSVNRKYNMARRRIIFATTGATSQPISSILVTATPDVNADGDVTVESLITSDQYRYYNDGTAVTFVAPATNPDGHPFAFWRINDTQFPNGQVSITFNVTQNAGAVAYYKATNGALQVYLQQFHFDTGMCKVEVYKNGSGDFAEQQQLFVQDLRATVIGGSGNYFYTWSNGESGPVAIGTLADADYANAAVNSIMWVKVKDLTTGEEVTIYQRFYYFEHIRFDITVSGINCVNNTGTLTIALHDAQDVTGPYGYHWGMGPANFTNTITYVFPTGVSHARFDFSDQVITVDVFFPVSGVDPLQFDISGTDSTDLDNPNGTATVNNIHGGTGPYTIAWSTTAVTPTINGLAAGTYAVTITDSKTCTLSASITIGEPEPNEVTINNCISAADRDLVWKSVEILCNDCKNCD